MDLNDFEVFVRVVDEHSFTGAAERLGLPKSTVSRRIARLEDDLGLRLLHRTTRSIQLTDAGRAFYQRAARVVADAEDAERTVKDLAASPRGRLRLTAPVELGADYIAPLSTEFLSQYPDVQLDIDLTGRYVDLVAEGYDLAIRAGVLPESTLIARKLSETQRKLFASPAYVEAHGVPASPKALDEHDCVVFSPRGDAVSWTIRTPKGERSIPVRARLAVNHFEAIKRACIAGVGIAQLPEIFCKGEVEDGTLVVVLPDCGLPPDTLWAVYPSARNLSPKVRAFVDFLAERFVELIERNR